MGKRGHRTPGRRTSGPDSHRRWNRESEQRAPRDPAADRALFEQALDRLEAGDIDKRTDEAAGADAERQARFAKRVARGEVEPEASIDLHGLARDEATARLRRFLSTAPVGEAVLVIHGRSGGIVRAATIAELDRHPRVAEHVSAPRHLGGEGARLVRLRR
jgi:DNA-nicking Smr family endonuclease